MNPKEVKINPDMLLIRHIQWVSRWANQMDRRMDKWADTWEEEMGTRLEIQIEEAVSVVREEEVGDQE